MSDLRRSIAYSAVQTYVSIGLQLVSTAVLSRILTPAQVGVFAIAAVFAALASTVRDFGIGEYLIQAKDLDTQRIRAAFLVNIVTSWSMGLAMLLLASPVGAFYRSPEITTVMQVQSVNFLLIPFGAINMAWFRRELNFRPIFFCSVASDVVSLIVAIGLGLRGLGALSLAYSSLAGVVITVVVSMALRPKEFPRWPGTKGFAEVARFGAYASGLYAIGQLGRGAPEMILGRALDITGVALFSRGGGLMQMFRMLVTRAVGPVFMPYFARADRDDGNVSRAYTHSAKLLNGVAFTIIGFLGLAAFPLIRIVYGPQWDAAVPLAQILCVAGFMEMMHTMAKEALMSSGKVKLATRLQFLQQLAQVLGLLLAIPLGLTGACWGMVASAVCTVGLSQWHMRVGAGFTVAGLWESVASSLLVALLALAPMVLVVNVMPAHPGNYIWQLLIGGSLTTLAWLAAVRATRHPLWGEVMRAANPLRTRLQARRIRDA
ncbi:MAG: oligosaccharide flippase family protein [Burkholderiales bacterium]|nr:oligosaccharide flippase family protein [Burkholderiales bacterium]